MKQKWIGMNWVLLVLGNLWNLGFFHILGGWTFFNLWKPNVSRKFQTTNPNHTFVRNKTCVFWKESSPDDTFHNELMSHYPSPSWCQVAVLKLMMEGCNLLTKDVKKWNWHKLFLLVDALNTFQVGPFWWFVFSCLMFDLFQMNQPRWQSNSPQAVAPLM